MSRLVIAIDCDDVLLPSSEFMIATYNQRYDTRVLVEHVQTGKEEWEAAPEEVFRRLNDIHHSEEYGRIPPSPDAIEVVRRLSHLHELHLVTARPVEVMKITERMLDRYFPDSFTSVIHAGPGRSKGEVCDSVRADVLIDDNLKHLRAAKECGVQWRLWFGDYPWQHDDDAAIYTKRVKYWYEVEDEIGRISR